MNDTIIFGFNKYTSFTAKDSKQFDGSRDGKVPKTKDVDGGCYLCGEMVMPS